MVLRRARFSPTTLTLYVALALALGLSAIWWLTGGPFGKGGADAGLSYASGDPAIGASGATDRQIADLQTKVQQRPDQADLYAQLGGAYLQKARETADPSFYAKVEEVLQRALQLEPNNFGALTGLGSLALSRHQFRGALDLGQRAQAINPDNAGVYGIIGDAHIELGEYDAAVQSFQAMIDHRPDLASYSRVSYARELYGQDDGALEAMIKAANAGAPNAEGTSWTMTQAGNLYFNRGDFTNAERYYRKSIFNYKDYPHGYAGLAKILAARGKFNDAIKLYTKVTRVLPLPEYVIALGDVQQAAGRKADAARSYDLVVAEEQLFAAAGGNNDLELALFDADHGRNLSGVLAQAQQAQTERPSVKGDDALAWTLFKTGDIAGARTAMQRALRLGTNDPLMLYHAGAIAYAAGDHVAARQYLEALMNRNPHFSVLYEQDAARLWSLLKDRKAALRPLPAQETFDAVA